MNAVIEGADPRFPHENDEVIARLQELRDARIGIRDRSLSPPTISKRLVTAQQPAGEYPFSLLVTWKLTSGVAHGRRSAMYHLLDREVLATNAKGASIWMTSSFGSVAGTYRIALHYLMRLLTIALSRNGTHLDF